MKFGFNSVWKWLPSFAILVFLSGCSDVSRMNSLAGKFNGNAEADIDGTCMLFIYQNPEFGSEEFLEICNAPSFRSVTFVNVHGTNLDDSAFSEIDQWQQIKKLDLRDVPISDQAIASISKLENIESLELSGTAITPEALPHLAKMKSLRFLSLGRTGISQKGVDWLSRQLPDCNVPSLSTLGVLDSIGNRQ